MTDSEALQMLVDAAEAIDVWYRDGGNANTDRYRILMSQLGQATQVYQQRAQARQQEMAAEYQRQVDSLGDEALSAAMVWNGTHDWRAYRKAWGSQRSQQHVQ